MHFSTKEYCRIEILTFEILTKCLLTMPLVLNNWAQVCSYTFNSRIFNQVILVTIVSMLPISLFIEHLINCSKHASSSDTGLPELQKYFKLDQEDERK